jgi:ADP-ribosylglycohydrolase
MFDRDDPRNALTLLGVHYGAVVGDICGSIYQWNNRKTDKPSEIELINSKCYFTDDTVLTAAVADAARTDWDYQRAIYAWANRYSDLEYGTNFFNWFHSDNLKPYQSYGNGSAMRVSYIGWAFTTDTVSPHTNGLAEMFLEEEARASAEVTHNHPEGIKGAQAVATAIFLARKNESKDKIKQFIQSKFEYDLNRTLDEIRPTYRFDVTCQGSVPQAIIAFLESHDFVSAIQNAISIGGDSDTIACITGSIAEAYYKEIPQELKDFAKSKLPDDIQKALGYIK